MLFVTGNANKLRETREILGADSSSPFEIVNRKIDLAEIQGTTQDVSIEKCRRAAEIIGGPVITEDTALGFDALNGLPGPYIKWFLSEIGNEGLYKLLDGFPTRSAAALCTYAYSPGPSKDPNTPPEVFLFEGRTEGTIVLPRGLGRFGWDPIFEVKGSGKTYAEMTSEEKNVISHRSKAIGFLKTYLTGIYGSQS
ncbi:hypothetical protein BS47DRAFT_1370326 [Hydnum rufescens UP504]|uniref:Inosine triphosphate pyrophosphatase n=1 Tax=Hydnum rufescens UP504 TaxID=1448309 RepID=A0A9P6E2E0_9AGAM|nr:hypothetical protein BS47DRAFT_1370326 [Hydnum rufescens UP504]